MKVGIIGAGPAGLASARFLRDKGFDIVVFEKALSVGGVWGKSPLNTAVYKSLRTNIPTSVMQSPSFPFSESLPSFVTPTDLCQYFEDYTRHFNLSSTILFGCTVVQVKQKAKDHWEVVYEHDKTQGLAQFNKIVVANGHYEKEFSAHVDGLKDWLIADNKRTVVHAKAYTKAEDFEKKSVLIIGARSSGQDIARETKAFASRVYVMDNKCALPDTAENHTYVPRGTKISSEGYLVWRNTEEEQRIDGPPVDVVVMATGYVYSFPFLGEDLLDSKCQNEKHVAPLYQHLIHARRPSLAFVGIPVTNPCPLRLFEVQACYLAAFWKGEVVVSEMERLDWVETRREKVGKRLQDFHGFSPSLGTVFQYLKELINHVPTVDKDAFAANLDIVEEVYAASHTRKPNSPCDDDVYRDYNYHGKQVYTVFLLTLLFQCS